MSSDDGDLGGYGPTTPAHPVKTSTAKRNARSTKPAHVQADAGPSKQATRRGGKTRGASVDAEVIYLNAEEEADELASVQTGSTMPQQNRRKTSVPVRTTGTRQQVVNGNKGKQRAGSRSGATRKHPEPEVQFIEDTGDEEQEEDLGPALAQAINQTVAPSRTHHRHSAKDSAVIRERKRAEEAEARCQELLKQLDEMNTTRLTEPEKLLEAFHEQHRVEIEAKDKLIHELNSALARVEPMSKTGRTSVLNLLTREAADEEKRTVLHEVNRLKEDIAQRDVVIQEKNKLISEKETYERELKYELQLERENSQRKPPASAQRGRGGILGSDDPKHTEVIKFYEDTTNLLIPNMKVQPGNSGKDDWVLTCVYSYVGEGNNPPTKSLNFSLRTSHENKAEAGQPDNSTETMFYTPQMLEHEPAEFTKKLGFLGSSFSFPRTQLPLFLRTMYETIGGALEEGGDSDVEIVDS
ncbi:hypothetical protein V5O48_008593 [Marasmius crinis-equi]|uniref:Monopolin complex subunit Csm1/Pcs1 C-terminal domain-containing protein n=1 Tax=Marasmius crinis-equi TaxID=585013 RepID=A0ABR3FDI7_9AGAR